MGIQTIEKIRNEEIRAIAGVANISEKIREVRQRWLGHVARKTEDVVMRIENKEDGSRGHRKIGRPKLRWSDVRRKDMKEKQVKIEEAQDRRTLRIKT